MLVRNIGLRDQFSDNPASLFAQRRNRPLMIGNALCQAEVILAHILIHPVLARCLGSTVIRCGRGVVG